MGRTVNPLSYDFEGSNPSLPTQPDPFKVGLVQLPISVNLNQARFFLGKLRE
jgi:hypothetical protein